MWPAAATATPLNARSDEAALHAYRSYLENLVSIGPAWRRTDNAYVTSISGQCRNVLKALKHARQGTFSAAAVLRFGIEAGGDLDAVGYSLAQPALTNLASTLDPLHWSSAATGGSIRGFVTAESNLIHLPPSNLCADARALAATHGRSAGSGTRQWVKEFAHRVSVAGQHGSKFLTILGHFATPADHATITSIEHLLSRFDTSVANRAGADGKKLLAVLGL